MPSLTAGFRVGLRWAGMTTDKCHRHSVDSGVKAGWETRRFLLRDHALQLATSNLAVKVGIPKTGGGNPVVRISSATTVHKDGRANHNQKMANELSKQPFA